MSEKIDSSTGVVDHDVLSLIMYQVVAWHALCRDSIAAAHANALSRSGLCTWWSLVSECAEASHSAGASAEASGGPEASGRARQSCLVVERLQAQVLIDRTEVDAGGLAMSMSQVVHDNESLPLASSTLSYRVERSRV